MSESDLQRQLNELKGQVAQIASPPIQTLHVELDENFPNARLPTRGSGEAAGYDLYAAEEKVIPPLSRAMINTGVKVVIAKGRYGRVAPRSGLAVKKGIDVFAGVIDSDYTGNLCVILFNSDTKEPVKIDVGDRIAQLIITPHDSPQIIQVKSVTQVSRVDRGGGFGSTGK
jgi:dUTP pyrophosphatase